MNQFSRQMDPRGAISTDFHTFHKILQHLVMGMRYLDMGIQNLDMGIRNLDMGIRNFDMGIQNLELKESSILIQKSRFCFKCIGFETFDYVDLVRTAILPWTKKNASSRARFWTRFVKKWIPAWVLGPRIQKICHPNWFLLLVLTTSGSDGLASRIGWGWGDA